MRRRSGQGCSTWNNACAWLEGSFVSIGGLTHHHKHKSLIRHLTRTLASLRTRLENKKLPKVHS